MKKVYLSLSVMIFSISFSNAQSWSALGTGTNNSVATFAVFNGNLIAGGWFDSAGGVPVDYLTQWNGHVWDSLESNDSWGTNAVCAYDSELYVTNSNVSNPPLEGLNDTIWAAVPTPPSGIPQYFFALLVYNGKLYAGGGYGQINNICSWDKVSCDTLLGGTNGAVYSLGEFNGNLYVGGSFDNAGRMPARNIAIWNGTSWNNAGKGMNGPVFALAAFNNTLYAGGAFDSAGGASAKNIAVWNGSNWAPVGTGVSNTVDALTSYGSVLIAGGIFDTAGGVICNKIAQWNGSTWSAMDGGITGKSTSALYNDNGILYVGGEFTKAGTTNANNVAQWTSPLGINELSNNSECKIYPNPSTGIFTLQSSAVSHQLSVEIYNMMGQKIYSQFTMDNGQLTINLSNQPNGIYFYRVLNEDGSLLGEGKVVIQK